MTDRISFSFMQTMRAYLAKEECGNVVKEQYVEGRLVERRSKEMDLGSYFEFILSGALPKGGKIPKAKYMVSRVKKKASSDLTIEDMTEPYRRTHFNCSQVKMYFDRMGIKIVHAGKKLTKGNREGTIDLIVEFTKDITFQNGTVWKAGDRAVFDVKYSGMVYDRWEKFGWLWSDIQKLYHGPQAIQYSYISNLPFYFLVVSNTNKQVKDEETEQMEYPATEVKLFRVPVDEHLTSMHLNEGNKLFEEFKILADIGFVPLPSLKRCAACSLYDKCTDRAEYPQVEDVDLTIGI